MGIHKVGRQSSRHRKRYSSIKGKHKEAVDNPIFEADFCGDSDDYELAEINCELGMVEGQMCNIPYELYDLPDLREILSLETWNSCLTEEERLHLAAYLPDMDQQTFCLTMKEIFDGSDLHFGNPLDVFFKRLQAGFYPPKVAQVRDALQFLQRKKYYCSLRSYNDRMVQTFIDMRSLWDQCEMSSNVEERISILSKKRKHRLTNLLDLNKLPKDDHQISQEINLDMAVTKPMASKRGKDSLAPPSMNGMEFVASTSRGKGLLKTKASGNSSFPAHNQKAIGCEMPESFRRIPKGVLKIVPKISSVQHQQSESLPRGSGPTFLVSSQGLQNMKSSLPAYLHFPHAVGLFESPIFRNNAAESAVHLTMNHPKDRRYYQDIITRTCCPSENSGGKVRQIAPSFANISMLGKPILSADDVKRYENEIYRHGLGAESFWQNLPVATDGSSSRPSISFPFDLYPRIPEVISRSTLSGNGKQGMLMVSSGLRRQETEINSEKPEKQLSYVSEGSKDKNVLPLTYKRRKAVAKISKLETGKTLIGGNDLSSSQHFGEDSRAMKIRFTG